MPYIITTKTQHAMCNPSTGRAPIAYTKQSRHAVATLEEAQSITWHALIDAYGADSRQVSNEATAAWHALTESGGTIGPLPDRTVIEVRCIEWLPLARRAGFTEIHPEPNALVRKGVIDAYNAQHAHA